MKKNNMAQDFSFLNEKEKEKKIETKINDFEEIKPQKRKKDEKVMEFRGEEITITKDTVKNKSKKKTDDDSFEIDKYKKSKIGIFFLILALIVLLGYGYYSYKALNFSNLQILDIVKSLSFVLIGLVMILVLFKVNNKASAPYVVFLALIIMGYSVFSVSYAKEDLVYVSDFINHEYQEVIDWTESNKLTLKTLHEYSDTVLVNHVIMQEYGVTTLVSDIDSFTVTISDGANPYKEVVVPNFIGFNYDDVMKYIKDNHLTNVDIEFTISDKARDTVIEQVGSGTLKRNDKIKFVFSYGEEIQQQEVKDLKGLSLFEATSYLKRYGIKYEIIYDFDKKINKNYVISQDKINEITDNIKLTVSKGKEIIVPNLSKMSSSDITKWAINNNIKLKYEQVYNKEYDNGEIIKVSSEENDKIEEGSEIIITTSLGSLVMPEIKDIAAFKLWATENNIHFEENLEYSTTIKSGELIGYTPKSGEKITENDTIILTISKGKSVTVPNLVGLTKNEITNKCKNVGVSCSFKYGSLTEGTKKDVSIAQSKKSGVTVAEGTNITITLSSGIIEKITIPNFTGKTKSEISASCQSLGITCNFNYSNNFSETLKDTAISQDKNGTVNKGSTINITLSKGSANTYTIVIDGSLLSLGNPEQTKTTLKNKLTSACPGVNFNFTFKSVNSGIGYLNPDSQVKVGSNTFTEGKTYNVIINSN